MTRPLIPAVLIGLALATAAPIPASAQGKVRLIGSGASFPFPIYATWFKDFSRKSGGITVDYQAKGSGAGVQDLINQTVDFAGSDSAMTDEQIAKVASGVQLLPLTAGEVVLAYNLPGVKDLKLSREVYPAIFLGQITKWNDPKIKAANPGANLPDLGITVVRRADSSGTTFVFTNHLSAISPEWKKTIGAGNSVNWPSSDKIVAAPKNDGVTATVKQTAGAIGYIEYSYAKLAKVEDALLQNKAGQYVDGRRRGRRGGAPQCEAACRTCGCGCPIPRGRRPIRSLRTPGCCSTRSTSDPAKAAALRQLVEYCLTDGQKMSAQMGYIPLPANVVAEVRKAVENIK